MRPHHRLAYLVLISIASLAGTLSPARSAAQQPPSTPAPAAAPRRETASPVRDPRLDLLRGITLNARQRAQIDSIELAFNAEARQAEARSTSAGETVLRLRARATERQRAIRAVLTPAQQAVYDRNLAELRAWMRREGHP